MRSADGHMRLDIAAVQYPHFYAPWVGPKAKEERYGFLLSPDDVRMNRGEFEGLTPRPRVDARGNMLAQSIFAPVIVFDRPVVPVIRDLYWSCEALSISRNLLVRGTPIRAIVCARLLPPGPRSPARMILELRSVERQLQALEKRLEVILQERRMMYELQSGGPKETRQ